jgi:hypothetical protein
MRSFCYYLFMASTSYNFETHWRVAGKIDDVYAILFDIDRYPQWWPSLARSYRCIQKGDAMGLGAKGEITTKGFLPYVIRWSYEVVETDRPNEFRIVASGDLVGDGHWVLKQIGGNVDVTYYWNVRTEKPLLKFLAPLLRPLFAWNHDWVMAQGKEGLLKELKKKLHH